MENTLFRHFPAVPGIWPDSGGASLPSGSVLPGIPEIPGFGHVPEMAGNGRNPGSSGFRYLSDYCVVRIRNITEKVTFPGSSGSAKTAEILSDLFGHGSGNPGFPGPGSGHLKGRPRFPGTLDLRGVPARPPGPGHPWLDQTWMLSNGYPGSTWTGPEDRSRMAEHAVTMFLKEHCYPSSPGEKRRP